MGDALRVVVPDGWSDADAAEGLLAMAQDLGGGPVRKALKSPTPSLARADARAAFLRLQGRFAQQFQAIVETTGDVAGVAREVGATAPGAAGLMEKLVTRQHRRAMRQVNSLLETSYEAAFTMGLHAGGAARVPLRNELEVLRRLRVNENSYGGNFLTDVAYGEGQMDYTRRAAMYAQALEEVYWQGYVYADLSPGRYVRWVMPYGRGFTETEHCLDCAVISGNRKALRQNGVTSAQAASLHAGGRWGTGVYGAQELAKMGVFPQSGKLLCTTHCRCYLQPCAKPQAQPRRYKAEAFRSLDPKEFTGTTRDEDGRRMVLRQAHPQRRAYQAAKADATEHRHVGRTGGRR